VFLGESGVFPLVGFFVSLSFVLFFNCFFGFYVLVGFFVFFLVLFVCWWLFFFCFFFFLLSFLCFLCFLFCEPLGGGPGRFGGILYLIRRLGEC